jgi:di/tricarboxylate transporter
MKRNVGIAVIVLLLLYILSYAWIRQTHKEVWEKDNNAYVIFPVDRVYLYYLYRPLSIIDSNVTGMRFHIGQHR